MDTNDTEGLKYLRWSMFDCPYKAGTGYKFMEREPVLLLDDVVQATQMNLDIRLGYVTPHYAKMRGLVSIDSHRIGKAVKMRILSPKKRMRLVSALILRGVHRIGIDRDMVYFDTDDQKPAGLMLLC